jgi:3-methyladenine DNA glycosylase AlkD
MTSVEQIVDRLNALARPDQVEGMVRSWDVCDQVCMNLFEKTPLAWHDKQARDEPFIAPLPLLKRGSTDERNDVKKAVNWALRNVGKRNPRLNRAAIAAAQEIRQLDSRAARWIASNATRELESEAVQKRLKSKR